MGKWCAPLGTPPAGAVWGGGGVTVGPNPRKASSQSLSPFTQQQSSDTAASLEPPRAFHVTAILAATGSGESCPCSTRKDFFKIKIVAPLITILGDKG